jgi:hypothetical protein
MCQDQYQDILTTNSPDAGYEYFWLNFKDSVHNATKGASPALKHIASTIPQLTDVLNQCKGSNDYDIIGKTIHVFLKSFLMHSLLLGQYHREIAYTNLKRWIKCCAIQLENPNKKISSFDPLHDKQMKYLYFLHRCAHTDPDTMELCHITTNTKDSVLNKLMSYSIANTKYGILDKLLESYPEWTASIIGQRYGITLPIGIKNSSKILRQIKSW